MNTTPNTPLYSGTGEEEILISEEEGNTDNMMSSRCQVNGLFEDEMRMRMANNECMICLSQSADAVILVCGHGGICFDCGLTLCHSKVNPRCHLCRKVRLSYFKITLFRE